MFSAVLVGIAMTYLMPLIEHMPLNALAAIIISGVLGLFDYHEGFHLFRVRQRGHHPSNFSMLFATIEMAHLFYCVLCNCCQLPLVSFELAPFVVQAACCS